MIKISLYTLLRLKKKENYRYMYNSLDYFIDI